MASITTILGTDSVSSSRIVLNNNFVALNDELADIANLLNTTTQVLTLTGLITGGTLKIKNTSNVETFKVNDATAEVNVPTTFNQDVVLGNGLIYSVDSNPITLPIANAYNYTTYILNSTSFAGTNLLAEAEDGQQITFIASGGSVTFDTAAFQGPTAVSISANGSITVIYDDTISKFYIISSQNATITY